MLLVAGPVTDHLRLPLLKAYEAMPAPKGVLALGACAIFGGVFWTSFASLGGVARMVPVDILIPGCPRRPWRFCMLFWPSWGEPGLRPARPLIRLLELRAMPDLHHFFLLFLKPAGNPGDTPEACSSRAG